MTGIAFAKPVFGPEEERATSGVLQSGWVVGGPNLAEFEKRCAALGGAEDAVGVSSWTTGAFLALKALGVGPGDEVIVPSLTFIASVNVIVHAGATPVFADIDPRTYNIDPLDVARKINHRTKAIMPIDQIGLPCEINRILDLAKQHNLLVIQDAACSMGSRFQDKPIGGLAPVTIFSLHARKLVTTGEGGMILTQDPAFAARLRILRHQGMSLSDFARHGAKPTTFETYPEIGYNFRITDIQAAIGLCQLDRLDRFLAQRRHVAERYIAALSNHPHIEPPHVPDHVTPNWQSFQVRLTGEKPFGRNELMDALFDKGIPTRRGVMASHREQPYRDYGAELPNTERAADECMQLPMHSAMTVSETDQVLAAINELYERG